MKAPLKKEIYRIIDANLNRSREGLRVCEDISRFILNSPRITGQLKALRHEISDIVKTSMKSGIRFLECRDSETDVGRCSGTAKEMKRGGYADIFMANIERVKESLRVLEEFFKLVDKKKSSELSTLRFKAYEIEKKAVKSLGALRNIR